MMTERQVQQVQALMMTESMLLLVSFLLIRKLIYIRSYPVRVLTVQVPRGISGCSTDPMSLVVQVSVAKLECVLYIAPYCHWQ